MIAKKRKINKKIAKLLIFFFVFFFLLMAFPACRQTGPACRQTGKVNIVFGQEAQSESQQETQPEPQLEIKYPQLIPGVPPPTSPKTDLPVYVRYIYVFILVIGGFATLLMLVIGGVRYVYSAGNLERIKDAKNQIYTAILGLVILLCSFLILYTINPQLTVFHTNPLEKNYYRPPFPLSAGVYFCAERMPIPYFYNKTLEYKKSGETVSKQEYLALKETKEKIDKNCYYFTNARSYLPDNFEDNVSWVYLVPEYQEKEYGVIIFEKRKHHGKSAMLFGDQNKGKGTALVEAMEWKLSKEKIGISSAIPFLINRHPKSSWYVKLYELIDFNRDKPGEYKEQKCEKIADTNFSAFCNNLAYMTPTYGCKKSEGECPPGYYRGPNGECLTEGSGEDSDIDSDSGTDSDSDSDSNSDSGSDSDSESQKNFYLACRQTGLASLFSFLKTLKYPLFAQAQSSVSSSEREYKECLPKVGSVEIEGDLFIVFFKEDIYENGEIKWTLDTELCIISRTTTTTYDTRLGFWFSKSPLCKEVNPDKEEGRTYPCARKAVVISGQRRRTNLSLRKESGCN